MGAYVLISVLILIASILLILVVLVQNSKGGGLASNFSGSNSYMGVRKTADFLEKSTWSLAIVLLLLSVLSVFVIPRGVESATSLENQELQMLQDNAGAPKTVDFTPPPARENE